eukprot:CAMPEP_0201718480 /NCGR_PEP_ID=MMETSP0593-20130828/3985_1 /ASSEMBLY_ACC=CAM_ASM_000672 /TAXON_ID=267983 /ORGANISM="Skeletonema japonicum, Strain CCMP2506" /LENGTH=471 /DNA_ID=CAMNT_0048208789 /DNA_START=148 /DNA_END=1563 /DNA_ORIENTATION=+
MKPTDNDVLSGRGASFNQHPGNEHFRKMIEDNKDAYMKGTKKQKMNQSNIIVEAIYSMDPPGRFLKKCIDTGEWKELSKRDAADRVAQAIAYAIRGKAKSKQRREERRRSRSSLQQKSQSDVVSVKSSPNVDLPTQSQNHVTNNNHSGGEVASSAAKGPDTRRGGASNDAPSTSKQPHVPENSSIQQQLLQQLQLPSSTTATLPTSLGNSIDQNVIQNGLVQLLLQTLQQQQQQQQQQQLSLQHVSGQNPLGQLLQSQFPLQPASHEGLLQMLNQVEQQQQQNTWQQLLLQQLLNQQNVLPSASLAPPISLSDPLSMTGSRPIPANINLLQILQQQSNPSNALLLNRVLSNLQYQPNSNTDISDSPLEIQQMDHQRMTVQNQLLASSLGASSNNQFPPQQQQSQLLDPLLQQTLRATLQLQQNSQGLPQTLINFGGPASANAASQTAEQEDEKEGGGGKAQRESEDGSRQC